MLRPIFRASFLLIAFSLAVSISRGADAPVVFGQSTQSESALVGIMYDLKQTQTRQPTKETADTYFGVVSEFITKGWDEDVFNRYYRVSRPVYTTQIFIPNMSADDAPKAFGAQGTVKTGQWVIHYKAQVSPPTAGTYRFWGASDDMLAVAVNGKTELVYFLTVPHGPKGVWTESDPNASAPNGYVRPGDWFTASPDDVIDLDVLIGERPGGWFNAYLMIEKKDGPTTPMLPIFQVAPYDTPVAPNSIGFAKTGAPWKCLQ